MNQQQIKALERAQSELEQAEETLAKAVMTRFNAAKNCDHKYPTGEDALDHSGVIWSVCKLCKQSVL